MHDQVYAVDGVKFVVMLLTAYDDELKFVTYTSDVLLAEFAFVG